MRALAILLLAATAAPAQTLEPYLVKDLRPGKDLMRLRLQPFTQGVAGNVLFFGVENHLPGLWRTDGTEVGTHRLSRATSSRWWTGFANSPSP